MKLLFAGDHAGFELKKELMAFVKGLGYEVEDLGPFSYDKDDDYPDFVIPLARLVAEKGETGESGRNGRKGLNQKEEKGERGEKGKERGRKGGEEKGEMGREVRGIVVAGSGQGEIIAMNRVRGARAALFCPCPHTNLQGQIGVGACNLELIKASRDHNDSNIFALGARFCTLEEAKAGIKLWLETPFSGDERHRRRLAKIDAAS